MGSRTVLAVLLFLAPGTARASGDDDGLLVAATESAGCVQTAVDPRNPGASVRGAEFAAKRGQPSRTIVFVNGINASQEKHCSAVMEIARMTGATVIGVFNESDGLVRDVAQSAGDRSTAVSSLVRNRAAVTLEAVLKERLAAGQRTDVWAHSQGGAIVASVVERMTQFEREQLDVTTMGSAAPKWPAGPHYEHYVHRRDLVPLLFGFDPITKGKGATVIAVGSAGIPRLTGTHDLSGYLESWRKEHFFESSWSGGTTSSFLGFVCGDSIAPSGANLSRNGPSMRPTTRPANGPVMRPVGAGTSR